MTTKKSAAEGERCTYSYYELPTKTNPKGEHLTCRAKAACPICHQCSKIDGQREHGHCTGHYGLRPHITRPEASSN